MKKVFYFLLLAFVTTKNLSAQTSTVNPFSQSDEASAQSASNEIWNRQTTTLGSGTVAKGKSPAPKDPNVVNTPIDGGVLVLLGIGVLYGKRRFAKPGSGPVSVL